MSRTGKKVKQFERWVLIGLVVILTAMFTVTGAVRGCERPPGESEDMGGSYEPIPGKRVTVSDADFRGVLGRYWKIYSYPGWGPSVRFGSELGFVDRKFRLPGDLATWQHIAAVGAAEAAGYRVGDEEVEDAVKELVMRANLPRNGDPRFAGRRFSPEFYDAVLQNAYKGTKADFEKTVREIVLKDKYLAGLVDAQRFSLDRADAFDRWKAAKERVDLQFAAVPAATFKEAVAAEEKTRSGVATVATRAKAYVTAAFEVRRLTGIVDRWKSDNGAWPESAVELTTKEPGARALGGRMPLDPWQTPFVYQRTADGADVFSAGPDGTPGTADDVGKSALDTLNTLGALQRTGDALRRWRTATGSWPADLADLTKSPPAAAGKPVEPPPLSVVPKDGWDRPLVYEAAGPVLASLGADGAKGTPDDFTATVTESRTRVPVGPTILMFVSPVPQDAWGKDLEVVLAKENPIEIGAVSAGPDGQFGTADDVTKANTDDLQAFYNARKYDFRLPMRRELEALYVVPALVMDEVFAKAWTKWPEHRPEEKAAWETFRQTNYWHVDDKTIVDAADAQKGYAADLLKQLKEKDTIAKDAKGWQVPAPETFGDRKDPPAKGTAGFPDPAQDPLYAAYLDKGWRRVVLRDLFFEKMLATTLNDARKAADARKDWEKKGRTGPEPAADTFTTRLATLLDFQPGEADLARGARFVQHYSTKPGEPISRADTYDLPYLGDYGLWTHLGSLKDDEYAAIPTILREGAVRSVWRNVKRHEERDPELSEVRDKVWPQYLESRELERARSVLGDLKAELDKAWAAAGEAATPEKRVAEFASRAAAASVKGGWPVHVERTGPFLGSSPPQAWMQSDLDKAPEAEKQAILRRRRVWRGGYDQVRTMGSGQGRQRVTVGDLGRDVILDEDAPPEGTRSAYLVQVAGHAYPSPEEFNGAEYLDLVKEGAYGDNAPWFAVTSRTVDRKGAMLAVLARAYDDWDVARKDWGIQTNRPIEMPKDAGGT